MRSIIAVIVASVVVACGEPSGPVVAIPPMPSTKAAIAGATFKGTEDGAGLEAEGGPLGGIGAVARGTGTGQGLVGIGGATGAPGVSGYGAGYNGSGIVGQGSGTGSGGIFAGGQYGPGVYAQAGVASTATDRHAAIVAVGGDIQFAGAAPSPSVPLSNVVTASNVAKAWAVIETRGAGYYSADVVRGVNVASVGVAADSLEVSLAAPVDGACAASAMGWETPLVCRATCSASLATIRCLAFSMNGLAQPYNFGGASPTTMSIIVFGHQ